MAAGHGVVLVGNMVVEGEIGQMAVGAFGLSMAAASSSVHVYTDCALVGHLPVSLSSKKMNIISDIMLSLSLSACTSTIVNCKLRCPFSFC